MGHKEMTKNYQGLDVKDEECCGVMAAQPGDPRCPVSSFRLYLSKLNKECDALFTYPKPKFLAEENTWFTKKPMGENALSNWMAKLSKEANLSQRYTNHSLRATVATRLSRAGVEGRHIIKVTGHKHEASLKSYVTEQTTSEKRKLSTLIHDTAPPTPQKVPKVETTTSVETAVPVAEEQSNVLPFVPVQNNVSQSNTALFAGAVFNNANIVINNVYK